MDIPECPWGPLIESLIRPRAYWSTVAHPLNLLGPTGTVADLGGVSGAGCAAGVAAAAAAAAVAMRLLRCNLLTAVVVVVLQ